MSHKQLQQIRGTPTSLSTYTPLQGEVIFNVVDGTIHVGDGAEVGGKWIFEPLPGRNYIGRAIIGTTPPPNPYPGIFWWDSFGGQLYLWYEELDSAAWVAVSNQPGPPGPPGTGGGGGGGTITAVIPGIGLSGGGTSGNITLNLIVPVSIAFGGTGATNAVAALANLGGLPLAGGILTGALGINPGRPHAPVGYPLLFLASNDGPEGVGHMLDTYANSAAGNPFYRCRFSRGTAAAPLAVQGGDVLGSYGVTGRQATVYGGVTANMQMRALETWTDAAAGTAIEFLTTTIGATSNILRAQISRGLVLTTAVGGLPAGGDMGAGTVNVPGGFYVNGVAVGGGGGNSITGVTAGAGLTGGGTSGNVTLSLAVPVAVASGGTGAITAPAALTSLGALPLAGGTMTGLLTLLGAPIADLHAATKKYVDDVILPLAPLTALGSYLPLAGGTMTGPLTLAAAPTANLHAATKQYVDGALLTALNSYLPLSGGTMTGLLTLSGPPTANLHAATKAYVDGVVVAGGGGTAWYEGSGVPAAALGNVGDFYIDGDTGDFYQKSNNGLVLTTLWDWSTAGGEENYSSPILVPKAGGVGQWVVFQTWDWFLYVLDYATGALRWRYPFAGPCYGRCQAADVNGDGEPEFFGASHDGTVRCIDSTGAWIWQWHSVYDREGTGTATSATQYSISDTTKNWVPNCFNFRGIEGENASIQIVSGTGAGQTREISATDPTAIWTYDPFSPIPDATSTYKVIPRYESDPYYQHAGTLVGNALYVCCFDGQIVRLNATTGAMVWRYQTGESIEPFPLVMDVDGDGQDEVCVGSVDGYFYCLSATTGALKWRTKTDALKGDGLDAFVSAADIDGDGVIEILASCRDNHVYILNGQTGAVKHATPDTGADIDDRPAIFAAGRFAFGNDLGIVWCCNTDGTLHWQQQLAPGGSGINSSPSIVNFGSLGGIVAVSCDMSGTVGAFSEAGAMVGQFRMATGIEGTPLIGDLDGDGNVEFLISTLGGHETLLRLTGTGADIWALKGNLQGPQGEQGTAGADGATGPQGPPGPPGTGGGGGTITLSGDVTGSGTAGIVTTLATVNSNVGTYQGLTIDAKGRITAAVNQPYLTANQTITLSGDATGSGTTALPLTLATVNSNVGTFQGLTIDAKGRVIAAANQNYVTGGPYLALAGGTMIGLLTLSGAPTANLHAATKLYVDNLVAPLAPLSALDSYLALSGGVMTGLLTLSGPPTANLHPATKQYVDTRGYITGNQTITLSGDATGSGTTALPLTLATVNANVGTFQGLTINAKGLVTAAVNQNYVTGGPYLAIAGGTLTGSLFTASGTKIALGAASARSGTDLDVIGTVCGRDKVICQGTGNVGNCAIVSGDAGTTGYVEWRASSATIGGGTRVGYLGYDSGTATLTLNLNASNFYVAGGAMVVGSPTGGAKATGTINAVNVYANNVVLTSDANLKRNIESLPDCMPMVMAVEPKSYQWRPLAGPHGPPDFTERQHRGFLAQDVAAVLGGDTDGVDLVGLLAVLWKACQELADRVAALEAA